MQVHGCMTCMGFICVCVCGEGGGGVVCVYVFS